MSNDIYITLRQAAECLEVTPRRMGILLKHLIPNGLRVKNTSLNNKGIKIHQEDLIEMYCTAKKERTIIQRVILRKDKEE